MNSPNQMWQIPLRAKPVIRQIGLGKLGLRPVERYRLLNFWSIHLYRQEGGFIVDGNAFHIPARSASITPPVVDLEYRLPGRFEYLYGHFTFPRTDLASVAIAVVQELGKDFDMLYRSMELTLGCYSSEPARAEARLWDVLWQLVDRTSVEPASGSAPHPAVKQTLNIIENRLGRTISVASLAEEVDLSQNHLTRLFHAAVGKTVLAYVRQRRAQRAHHLLLQTTQTIKAIAAEVNIPDLHLFNKIIRRELGRSPRQLRRQR